VTTDLAPIALFTFKRPEHTQRTLEALARNPEFNSSALHVFCDGSRRPNEDEAVQVTRAIVEGWHHPEKKIHYANQNMGLSKSIRAGVSEICKMYGKVIVIEDDLAVASGFLSYMNTALNLYADDARVMQISGHNFPALFDNREDAFFLRMTTSWGWGTWQRAWDQQLLDVEYAISVTKSIIERFKFDLNGAYPFSRMLKDQLRGLNDSWAIWWYLNIYRRNGLTLFPKVSLVRNDGFDGTGTHCGTDGPSGVLLMDHQVQQFPSEIEESLSARQVMRRHLIGERLWKRYAKDTFFRILG